MNYFKSFTTLLLIFCLSGCSFDDNIYLTSWSRGIFGDETYKQKPTITAPSKGYISVKKGDTVYGLSRLYNVPLRSFISINKLKPPYKLAIGQKLRLPTTSYHIVTKGDTVYSIARRYNVNMSSLVKRNSIKSPYTIGIGQKLWLPSSVASEKTVVASSKKTSTPSKSTYKKPTTTKTATAKPKTSTAKPVSYKAPNRSGFYFAWPLKGKIILPYGSLGKGMHNDGINIAGKAGQNVVASENGVVAYSGNELPGYGNLLLIKHAEGWISAYAHNDSVSVKKGQKVKKGQVIAKVGKTGNVSTPQLHFELRRGSKPLDPMMYLEKK